MSEGETILFSKRAATYFDTLQVPANLRKWFGQPAIQVRELLAEGLSLQRISEMCENLAGKPSKDMLLHPVHCTWPLQLRRR